MNHLSRREVLKFASAAAIAAATPFATWAQAAEAPGIGKGKKLLFFTRSQGFPHSVITRATDSQGKPSSELAFAEKLLKAWGEKAGYEVVVSKEGSIFTPENIQSFDAFIFYTTGDLTRPANRGSDMTSIMSEDAKKAFLKAIEDGKGFVGVHSATDTFSGNIQRSGLPKLAAPGLVLDPYIAMIGGIFTSHGAQQKAFMRVPASARTFPGLGDLQDFEMHEEWYAYTHLAPDLHVILVQDTSTMDVNGRRARQYTGPSYPATWARMHGKGRVFSTSMGHREDVWEGAVFQKVLMAGIAWASGATGGVVKGNLQEACPGIT